MPPGPGKVPAITCHLRRRLITRIVSTCLALIALLAAGCGGDDDSGGGDSGGGDKPAADSKEQTTKATPAAGGAPSYEDVKKLALADPQTKKACASGSRDIDVPPAEGGETYKRLLCGDRIAFDYVLGAGSTAPTTTTPAGRPWRRSGTCPARRS